MRQPQRHDEAPRRAAVAPIANAADPRASTASMLPRRRNARANGWLVPRSACRGFLFAWHEYLAQRVEAGGPPGPEKDGDDDTQG